MSDELPGMWEQADLIGGETDCDLPARNAEYVAPSRWRKKPVVIEAMRVTYTSREIAAAWCGGAAQAPAPSGIIYAPGLVSIETLEGTMWAAEGDWITKGVKGEFYPCKPDIFEVTYEPEQFDGLGDGRG